jgi:hypothetical protein
VAQAISALEGLARHRQYGRDGLLTGRAGASTSVLPARVRALLDTHGGAVAIHGLALTGAVVQLTASQRRRKLHLLAALASLTANKLFEIRNPYGRDGADQMLGVIYGYRVASGLVPQPAVSDDLFLRAVNAQVAVSYATAGLAKSLSSEWLSGSALELILRTNIYGSAPIARAIVERPWASRLLSWSTIIWESGYPLIYLLPGRYARLALWGVKGFHLGIAYTMGLPRFFWSFGASHEAVKYVLTERGNSC